MRPGHYFYFAFASDLNRHRLTDRRDPHPRAAGDAAAERPWLPARLAAAIATLVRRDHSLTDYPCRLPDGSIGRVAVVQAAGDWALVCRVA
jgi:hypothetical protein